MDILRDLDLQCTLYIKFILNIGDVPFYNIKSAKDTFTDIV